MTAAHQRLCRVERFRYHLCGATNAPIAVSPINDSLVEAAETVIANLVAGAGAGYALGYPTTGTVTIADNDVPAMNVKVTVSDDTAKEAGSNPGKFKITRQGSQANPLTVFFSLEGTARYGNDYTTAPAPGSATIPSGSSSKTIKVNPIDDRTRESRETVVLRLLPDSAYQIISPSTGTVKIISNE